LFEYSKKIIEDFGFKMEEILRDIHAKKPVPELLQITTHYEEMFLKEGRKINYLRAVNSAENTCSSNKTQRKATKRKAKTTEKKFSKISKEKS